MDEEMQMNPDFQLVMKFLQNIRPGDMDEESSQQLMAIGQRIQNGGALSDKEREMFESVVGAMPMEGENQVNFGAMTEAERVLAQDQGSFGGMTEAERQIAEEAEYFKRLREQQEQMYNMNQMPQEGFLVSPDEGGTPAAQMPNVTMPNLSDAEKMRIRMMRESVGG